VPVGYRIAVWRCTVPHLCMNQFSDAAVYRYMDNNNTNAPSSDLLLTSTTAKAPCVTAVSVQFPSTYHAQEVMIDRLSHVLGDDFRRFALASGVEFRHLAVSMDRMEQLSGFTDANETYLEVALDLGERALLTALDNAKVKPSDVDIIFSTTVTGLAVPSLETLLARRIGLREDVKRVPMFGLGCAGGAAGVARMHDYLRGHPDQVSALLAVELCTLTIQRNDKSVANLVATSLFGDGAGAVIAKGANHAGRGCSGPRLLATRSHIVPETEDVMGWKIGTDGFRLVLSADVVNIAQKYLADDVRKFLANHGLTPEEMSRWVCHPGGPAVIESIEEALELSANALDHTRNSLRTNGNLSSVSVLDVLRSNMADPPATGSLGLMIAMGPGFASELVLLAW
jgi:alkylresorcinol/alkylpyrone synthase